MKTNRSSQANGGYGKGGAEKNWQGRAGVFAMVVSRNGDTLKWMTFNGTIPI
jgi:hypothetical protein